MASGDAYNVSPSHVDSVEAAPAELNADVARKGSSLSSTAPAAGAPTVRYDAFISYSHAASAEVARGLQKWLQTYAKPWWRWRAINVFRDETDLTAAPALWSRIATALDQSSHFILLASPEAAQSKWINREIRYWLGDQNAGALDGPDLDAPMSNPNPERVATLLIALTAGDIIWDEKAGKAGDFDWSKTNAVPRQLSGVFSEEPQWVRPQDSRRTRTLAYEPFAQQFGVHAGCGPAGRTDPRHRRFRRFQSADQRGLPAVSTDDLDGMDGSRRARIRYHRCGVAVAHRRGPTRPRRPCGRRRRQGQHTGPG